MLCLPLFTGGGDLDKLSLCLLLFAGTGLRGLLPFGSSTEAGLLRPLAGGLLLRDGETESRRPLRLGDGLSLLALLGGGDREPYDGDRESRLRLFRGASLKDELLRRWDPPFGERSRPRGGLTDTEGRRVREGVRL